MALRSHAGLLATLLIAFAYALFAVFGTGVPARAPDTHIVTEMLHLPGATRVPAAQPADADAARQASPRQVNTLAGTILAPDFDSARASSQPASVHGPAVLTYRLSVIVAELSRSNIGHPLPWPEAPIWGAVFGRLHRSVVLHL